MDETMADLLMTNLVARLIVVMTVHVFLRGLIPLTVTKEKLGYSIGTGMNGE